MRHLLLTSAGLLLSTATLSAQPPGHHLLGRALSRRPADSRAEQPRTPASAATWAWVPDFPTDLLPPATAPSDSEPPLADESTRIVDPAILPVVHAAEEKQAPLPTPEIVPSETSPLLEGPGCCGPWVCGPPGRLWVAAEYLLWWTKGAPNPVPLLTTNPPTSTSDGILGYPDVTILFGGQNLDSEPFSGGRFSAGWWLNREQTLGAQGIFFFLGQRTQHLFVGSDAYPVLARPFFSVHEVPELITNNGELSQIIALPGFQTGSFAARASQSLWGAEGNALCNLCCGCKHRLDVLAGFRYLDLEEDFRMLESGTFADTVPVPDLAGRRFIGIDNFATDNEFYGGQVGLAGEYRFNRWYLQLVGKIAFGVMQQEIDITGSQTLIAPNGTTLVSPGNLLALPTNIGNHRRDVFAVVPEVNVNVGYQVTDHVRVMAGYSFLYLSNVVRPGDQIDRNIDVSWIPNFGVSQPPISNRPTVPFKESDFWAQGLNFGLELRW
ncbi:MAG: BBP7 family outer membrane beta-barrel protein [Gemmataceae bacterium]|nr:BBP7 family outer membrane beta-barrel protein [Gemmataceae bacterium]MDW8266055.1 BBP7 family outer membrane beta-barrel protein [Gemmataceae bacterium]